MCEFNALVDEVTRVGKLWLETAVPNAILRFTLPAGIRRNLYEQPAQEYVHTPSLSRCKSVLEI